MFFELTDSIVDDILFSMEDQGGDWFFDSANKTVASREMMEEAGIDSKKVRIQVENGKIIIQNQ